MVSTDSEEIKKISISSGASVPFMRSKINVDNSTIYDVIVEVVKEYSKEYKFWLWVLYFQFLPLLIVKY